MRAIEAAVAGQRKVLGKKYCRPRAERHPLRPVVLWIAISGPLIDEDRHNRKLVIRLIDNLFSGQKLPRVIDVRRWVRNRCSVSWVAEVTCRPGSVLDHEGVIAAMPLQPLMAKPERVAIRCGDSGHKG